MLAEDNKRRAKYQEEIKQIQRAHEQKRIADQLKLEQERVQSIINR